MSGSISSIDSSDLGNFYIVLLNESYKNVTGEKGKTQVESEAPVPVLWRVKLVLRSSG